MSFSAPPDLVSVLVVALPPVGMARGVFVEGPVHPSNRVLHAYVCLLQHAVSAFASRAVTAPAHESLRGRGAAAMPHVSQAAVRQGALQLRLSCLPGMAEAFHAHAPSGYLALSSPFGALHVLLGRGGQQNVVREYRLSHLPAMLSDHAITSILTSKPLGLHVVAMRRPLAFEPLPAARAAGCLPMPAATEVMLTLHGPQFPPPHVSLQLTGGEPYLLRFYQGNDRHRLPELSESAVQLLAQQHWRPLVVPAPAQAEISAGAAMRRAAQESADVATAAAASYAGAARAVPLSPPTDAATITLQSPSVGAPVVAPGSAAGPPAASTAAAARAGAVKAPAIAAAATAATATEAAAATAVATATAASPHLAGAADVPCAAAVVATSADVASVCVAALPVPAPPPAAVPTPSAAVAVAGIASAEWPLLTPSAAHGKRPASPSAQPPSGAVGAEVSAGNKRTHHPPGSDLMDTEQPPVLSAKTLQRKQRQQAKVAAERARQLASASPPPQLNAAICRFEELLCRALPGNRPLWRDHEHLLREYLCRLPVSSADEECLDTFFAIVSTASSFYADVELSGNTLHWDAAVQGLTDLADSKFSLTTFRFWVNKHISAHRKSAPDPPSPSPTRFRGQRSAAVAAPHPPSPPPHLPEPDLPPPLILDMEVDLQGDTASATAATLGGSPDLPQPHVSLLCELPPMQGLVSEVEVAGLCGASSGGGGEGGQPLGDEPPMGRPPPGEACAISRGGNAQPDVSCESEPASSRVPSFSGSAPLLELQLSPEQQEAATLSSALATYVSPDPDSAVYGHDDDGDRAFVPGSCTPASDSIMSALHDSEGDGPVLCLGDDPLAGQASLSDASGA